MLQQTQVATVKPYFLRFMQQLPTIGDLAAADEQAVLRLWQGLGYYSRARNLRAAAAMIIREHAGRVPDQVDALLKLPGIGRYTAGAVASIAFDTKAPIVDGNVARVICRVDRIESDPLQRETQQVLWRRATEILPHKRVGDFNTAMMELGATVCTPRSPQCLICPVNRHCEAFAAGLQDRIPRPRPVKSTPLLRRNVFCICRNDADDVRFWLIEQRPASGRWAGMWQFVTTEAGRSRVSSASVRAAVSVKTSTPRRIGTIQHGLTHRRYRFDVYVCDLINGRSAKPPMADRERVWASLSDLAGYPLPRPHLRVIELLRAALPDLKIRT